MMLSYRSKLTCLFLLATTLYPIYFHAESLSTQAAMSVNVANQPLINKPLATPSAPSLNAKAYILIDVNSGKIIAEKNSEQRLPPASLTKMMTLYVASNALHNQQIHLADQVRISHDAWKTGGSRMFVKDGQEVSIEDLLKGIIVDSGNDACVAIAEHLGGSESGFAEMMNQQASLLGMKNSHFTDSTGLPDSELYTTAKDLAILGQALIKNFPDYYHWYQQKWFSFNGIRQPNRNRLLWRNSQVDGIKTGHTTDAGFCLVSSALRENMRLLAVVLGSPSESIRADDSERLLNYGFRFFETHTIYKSKQTITAVPVYKGSQSFVNAGLLSDQAITIPNGQFQRVTLTTKAYNFLQAPVVKNQSVGELIVDFDGKVIEIYPIYALEDIKRGGLLSRTKDSIRLMAQRWF